MLDKMIDLLPLVSMMLATGAISGVMAGLLGVGGGIVIVPVLEIALSMLEVDSSIRMHVAVATSLAIIIPTSVSSARAHSKRGAIDFGLVKRWAAPIFLGSVMGTLLASQVDSSVLAAVFSGVAILVAMKMLLPMTNVAWAADVPRGILAPALPTLIGTLSSMMGIGGGTLSVPVLTLLNQPIHNAVATAALFGLLISIPGAFGFILTGLGNPLLPAGSLGYVNIIGFACIAPLAVLMAPLGAKLAHKLSKRHLGFAFGSFLMLIACRMLYRAVVV